jgi:hypothetical protein
VPISVCINIFVGIELSADLNDYQTIVLSIPSLLSLYNDSLSQYKNIRIGNIFISLRNVCLL